MGQLLTAKRPFMVTEIKPALAFEGTSMERDLGDRWVHLSSADGNDQKGAVGDCRLKFGADDAKSLHVGQVCTLEICLRPVSFFGSSREGDDQ